MPRIDMPATKNDFILEVRAFNFGDCVIDLAVIIPVKTDLALNGQLHRLPSLDHPGDAVVMLDSNRDLGNHQLLSFLLPRLYTAGYGWVEGCIRVTLCCWCIVWLGWYRGLLNKQRTAITARCIEDNSSSLFLTEGKNAATHRALTLHLLHPVTLLCRHVISGNRSPRRYARRSRDTSTTASPGIIYHLGQLLIRPTYTLWCKVSRNFADWADEDSLAL